MFDPPGAQELLLMSPTNDPRLVPAAVLGNPQGKSSGKWALKWEVTGKTWKIWEKYGKIRGNMVNICKYHPEKGELYGVAIVK